MIIKNVLPRPFKVILNGKTYDFPVNAKMEVEDKEGEFILSIQPLLAKEEIEKAAESSIKDSTVETVTIESEPVEIEKPKAKKNVSKSKKSRK
jgi:hypothetical protein